MHMYVVVAESLHIIIGWTPLWEGLVCPSVYIHDNVTNMRMIISTCGFHSNFQGGVRLEDGRCRSQGHGDG